MPRPYTRIRPWVVIATGLAALSFTAPAPSTAGPASITGPVDARGAMTCDFELPGTFDIGTAAGLIERDRIYMARRPGMLRKHIPFRPDPVTGTLRAGGRYLFDTEENAAAYLQWMRTQFVLDGTLFFDREVFSNIDCHSWSTIAAYDLADLHLAQVVFRTERWRVPPGNQRKLLTHRWPEILAAARARGLSGAWLLYSRPENLVSLISFAPRTIPAGPQFTDAVALAGLESMPALGTVFDDRNWPKVLDRTQWSFNIWFPNPCDPGDCGEPSLWPNSPLFPEPTNTDGVCVPSRGENAGTAPNDCRPHCGDGVWQAEEGENNTNCPSDVPYF